MASTSAPPLFFHWPWQKLGSFKYLLFLPIVLRSLQEDHSKLGLGSHLLLLCFFRYYFYWVFQIFSRMLFLVKRHLVNPLHRLGYAQVDREWHWDNPLILQALMVYSIHVCLPFFNKMPMWDLKGLFVVALLHIGVVEPLYYLMHRTLHNNAFLFTRYHFLHHLSITTEPSTSGTGSFLEHLVISTLIMIPVVVTAAIGFGSIGMLYLYFGVYELLRNYGHCNVEFMPLWPFQAFPILRYLLYTPSYHALHHEHVRSNYCLFMPLFDYLGNTLDSETVLLHEELHQKAQGPQQVPDYVFLLHIVDMMSSLHVPFMFRGFASYGYTPQWALLPFWPLAAFVMICNWIWGSHFIVWQYFLRSRFHQVRCVARYGFQYFLPFCAAGINKCIEEAILDADRSGVKVISLAALNKNEALNGGGLLFVEKHKNLRVRVVHGNTLTAAVIINQIPNNVTEVFLTGATSKLGRAIALYLSRQGIRVMMLTGSRDRFDSIVNEAPLEHRKNLVHVTKYQAGKNCKTWVVGKWLYYKEQMLAPVGTYFNQFVVPPIIPFRRDCTYGALAAMCLPDDVKGLHCCEYALGRNVIHACHAGGVIHSLEGWDHHEVGAIDVDRIDIVWEAALRHGFTPLT